MKKKLLYIVEAMGGGVFTYIVDLTKKLINNYDVYIAYAIRQETPSNYKNYFDAKVQLIPINNFTRAISPSKDFKAFFEIKRVVKEINPDIIHLHSSKAGVLGRWALNGHKTPMFYTPHGYSFLIKDSGKLCRVVYYLMEKISAMRCCTTISCSEGEHEESLKLTKKATYVNNGIDLAELKDLVSSVPITKEHPFTVFTLGRICYQKNPQLFNELALALPKIKFLWIGDGELRDKLTASNIEIRGWVSRKEALKYSLETDVFVLTSLWEGLPISLLEAMYMKKLCVVSDVIGNHDVIQNKRNGYVCHDVKSFAEAILNAKSIEAKSLIDFAYEDVILEYNTQVMAEKYRRIYEQEV